MVVEIRHADHVAPSTRKKLTITSPTSGNLSVGIVRSRTQTMEFSFSLCFLVFRIPDDGRNTGSRSLVPLWLNLQYLHCTDE
jgi:hypothetical protein